MPLEDDVLPAEEQPLPAAASPTTESPGYIPESNPEEDDKEDPADYLADRGDDRDDEESSDDDDDVEEDEGDEDEEEEEHLAPATLQLDTPPSPVHETEILEICLPLRKRLCRTAPTPMYEVGESSTAGDARQDGPAIARADLYGFVDMLDAAPGCLMSSELGYVTELVATVDHEDDIMYSLLEDAREDRSLLRVRVNMLLRDRPYHRRTALLMEEEARVSRVAWETGSDYRDAGSGLSETEIAYRGTKTAEEVTGLDDRVSEAAGTR
ncbi:hypothetical protein Tco_1553215 [Tanacetum coccineum]